MPNKGGVLLNEVIIYEGVKCEVIDRSETKVTLLNLEPDEDSDWVTMTVILKEEK